MPFVTRPDRGEVRVTVMRQASFWRILVENDGSAIPENQIPRLFEKYGQIDVASGQRYGGARSRALSVSVGRRSARWHRAASESRRYRSAVRADAAVGLSGESEGRAARGAGRSDAAVGSSGGVGRPCRPRSREVLTAAVGLSGGVGRLCRPRSREGWNPLRVPDLFVLFFPLLL